MPGITTMGRAAALLYSPLPLFFCCSPATNGPVSSTCKAEECDATLHNSTHGCRSGCACSQPCTCVCVSMPLSSSTSTWLQAPTTAAETSRPRCPLGGGTPSMQHLPHLCVAASHWPIGMQRRHQATRHWTLTRFHGRTLSFFHESACGTLAAWVHLTALCCAPLIAGCCGPCATTTPTTSSSSR